MTALSGADAMRDALRSMGQDPDTVLMSGKHMADHLLHALEPVLAETAYSLLPKGDHEWPENYGAAERDAFLSGFALAAALIFDYSDGNTALEAVLAHQGKS